MKAKKKRYFVIEYVKSSKTASNGNPKPTLIASRRAKKGEQLVKAMQEFQESTGCTAINYYESDTEPDEIKALTKKKKK